jgi:hypothetical protein
VSEREQSEAQIAFAELDQLVRHLGEELAGFRRRALQAEARVRELEAEGGEAPTSSASARTLAAENAQLTARLEAAGAQARQLLDRVRFLRQQHTRGGGDR